jgi:hypothetical protein
VGCRRGLVRTDVSVVRIDVSDDPVVSIFSVDKKSASEESVSRLVTIVA